MLRFLVIASLAVPLPVLAAGSTDSDPPTPTQTSKDCKDAQVWDEKTKKCVDPKEGRLDNDTLYKAVRELAYAGRPEEALTVLSAMTEGDTDRVLTYKGFANRKAGRMQEGLEYYHMALAKNPDNFLTRSYLGQAYVELGQMDAARDQLRAIRTRGGQGTWAEASLSEAIRTGHTFSY
jgi:Flp pilus assembly protein TadD